MMTAAQIFRDWRAGMIAGATLLHLTAFAGAWALIPPGTQTRLDRPIEASFAPAPSSDAVNMNSASLASEVVSTNLTEGVALEDAAQIVPPDAVKTDMVVPDTQKATKPDAAAVETVQPVRQPDTPPDAIAPEPAPAQPAAEIPPAPPVAADVPQQMAVLAPDILTTANPEESTSVPMPPPQLEPAQDAPVAPAVEQPKPAKTEKPKPVKAPKPKAEPAQKPVKPQPEVKRLANLDTKTVVKRAQQGGAGAIADIGAADDARTSGASVQDYRTILSAAIRARMRAMGSLDCERGTKSMISVVVSVQGKIGSVRLAKSSGGAVLDAAALAAVRTASVADRPNKPVNATIPINCPRT